MPARTTPSTSLPTRFRRAHACKRTTWVRTLMDDAGTIRHVFCDACRTIAVDAWDGRRKRRSRAFTYVDPMTFRRDRGIRRKEHLFERVRRAFA